MSNQSPAEGLRQQIAVWVGSKPMYTKDEQLGNIMELVTAYAATVEREARIDELNRCTTNRIGDEWPEIRVNQEVKGGWITVSKADRLAAIQGPQGKEQ